MLQSQMSLARLPVPTPNQSEERHMKSWSRPDFEEVSLGCEINCYAPAEA
jgi:coenzyme PQQ precursor peptide PqqA